MSKLPLRRTRKYRNARCQVHPYVREKFYRTYQRTMGKSYWPLLFTSGEVTRKLLLSESTAWTRGGGGGVGYSGFQVTGMIEWGQNSKHKKNPLGFNRSGFKQNPKNSLTNFRRAGKDITRKKPKAARIRGYYHDTTNLQIVLNIQRNRHLNQATQKNTCQIFLPKTKSRNRKFQTSPKNRSIIPVTWTP